MIRFLSLCALCIGVSGAAVAADPAAGQAKVDAVCSQCHAKADFAGKDAAALEATIKDIVAGKHAHKKKLKLTDEEAANIAAYLASK
jgi:mono/diheme cytochrome c family protein